MSTEVQSRAPDRARVRVTPPSPTCSDRLVCLTRTENYLSAPHAASTDRMEQSNRTVCLLSVTIGGAAVIVTEMCVLAGVGFKNYF